MAKSISVTVAVSQLPLVNCLLIGFKKADWKKGLGVTYTSMEYILKKNGWAHTLEPCWDTFEKLFFALI